MFQQLGPSTGLKDILVIYCSRAAFALPLFTALLAHSKCFHWLDLPGDQFPSLISQSDLHHFILDEMILLAFVAASSEILIDPKAHLLLKNSSTIAVQFFSKS